MIYLFQLPVPEAYCVTLFAVLLIALPALSTALPVAFTAV
jgi:hypothetical protein